MIDPHFLQKRLPWRETLRRIDKVADDLNVLLVVLALGLAVLDMTFFVAEDVVAYLPPVTSISYAAPHSGAD